MQTSLVRSLKTFTWHDVLRCVSQVQKKIKLNGTIMERLTKFWETKTWKNEEMSWMKLIEKLICLNRYLFLVTQSPRRNVLHPGFVFLAVLVLRSGDYIETCDPYREEHSYRCYVLPERHKAISMLPRPFDVKDASTQSRDLKHTKCHHLHLCTFNNEVGSMCSRSLTQSACASRP